MGLLKRLFGGGGAATRLEPTFDIKDVRGVAVPYQGGAVFPSFEVTRPRLDLAGGWWGRRVDRPRVEAGAPRTDAVKRELAIEEGTRTGAPWPAPGYRPRIVPGPENRMCEPGSEASPERFEGVAWYARRFDPPPGFRGAPARLVFLGVNCVADVFLNGEYLGWHEGGYTPFSFLLPPDRLLERDNDLRVRVHNPPWGSDPATVPAVVADWCNYAGILHEVYLESLPPARIDRLDAIPDGDGFDLTVVASGDLPPGARVRLALHAVRADAGGVADPSAEAIRGPEVASKEAGLTAVGDVGVATERLAAPSPAYWSPEAPALVVARADLLLGDRVLDTVSVQTGLRTVGLRDGRLALTGKPTFLCGVARHEDGPRGRTVTADEVARDLALVKGLGADFLRAGHYPNHPVTAILADRVGLAVAAEIPVWRHGPKEFEADGGRLALQTWREMTWRDRNRPSVLFWSVCNECAGEDPPAARTAHIVRLRDDLRTRYDDGRMVIQSAAVDGPGAHDASQRECGLAGWTFDCGTPQDGACRDGTAAFLRAAAEALPDRPVMATAFGLRSSPATGHPEWEGLQVEVLRETAAAYEEFLGGGGRLAGVVWSAAFDWHRHVPGLRNMGAIGMDRETEKPAAAELRAAFDRLRAAFRHGLPPF
ncbi:MAG: hypothetical protein FJ087_11470 [Deltaproteobacteria bacterium]|nr:hypothetical protein [Deltaproteobacteria bacterium]